MGCLYCGKEIGAFRLLRDREFCSVLHRKKYGDRLGKALLEIAAPEPAPAGVAGFLVQMPFQQGNCSSTLILWQTVTGQKRIRIGTQWPLTVDTSDATSETTTEAISDPAPIAACAPVEQPPQIGRWMAAPPAEPAAAFLPASAALTPAYTVRAPRFAAEFATAPVVDRAQHAPTPYYHWMPARAPEPVAAFVQASASPAPAYTVRAPRFAAGFATTLVVDKARYAPTPHFNWMPAPAPEPVAGFVQACAATNAAYVLRIPRFAAELEPAPVADLALDTPPLCERWMPAPAPEAVAAFVQTAGLVQAAGLVQTSVPACAAMAPADTLRLPRLAAELEPMRLLDEALFARVPAPEPVAAFVQTAAALALAITPAITPALAPRTLRLAVEREPTPIQHASPAACSLWMTGMASAIACGTPTNTPGPAYALSVPPAGAPPRMPAPKFTAELEPFPVLDEPLEAPAMCQQWMPTPAADPVFSYLQVSHAPAIAVPAALQAPVFALSLAAPYVPSVAQSLSMPDAEMVMAAVQPSGAHAPLVSVRHAAAIALPAIPLLSQEPFAAALPASSAAPEAAEWWLVASQASVPVSINRAPRRSVELAAPPAFAEPAPAMGKPAASPAPAPLESMLVASVAAPLASAATVCMQPFALAASRERTGPGFAAQRLAPSASKPGAGAPRLGAPQPIATLAVTTPEQTPPLLEWALPRPGLLPVEFHTHRLPSAPVCRPEWSLSRPGLLPPRFPLRAVLEKLEDPAVQEKAARKERGFVLNMPPAKRPPTVLMVAFRVAAGFLLATSLWWGVANFRGDRQLAVREEVSASGATLSAANSASPERVSNSGAPAQPASKGPVGWVRQTIADRASIKIAENFHGMGNWAGAAKASPAGWSRHPDGYMNTGALALFRPSLKFIDYHMEFFGQIETKSIGWTVRAADTRNYHAMKLTVVEAGMRPFVALVHYDVVDGKSGHRTETPLSVMVHNGKPMQFAVDVRGNRFVTSIDGEEVDSFIDNTLVAGGIGFFSDAGERARLYWMKVSRNDDWLGHVCAMLAEGAGMGSSAQLQRPELPGGVPAPGLPGGLPGDSDGLTLSAVWIGLPYLGGRRKGASRKARFFKIWRTEPWNT